MSQNNLRVIVVGGGAAGISAASTARTVNPEASVILFTEYEDVAYSPCGIPFVHGREIPDFKGLFLQTSEHYAEIGIDMTGNLAHRGLETHLVDEGGWIMSEVADPDIMEPVQKSLEELGAKIHFGAKVIEFKGSNGKVKTVSTTNGEIDCDVVIVATHKQPNNRLSREAGIKIGSTGGILVDDHMRTSVKDVYAAGDCVEVIHGVTDIPIQGLSGSHAYSQGRVAGANAAGGDRAYDPVYV